MQRVPFLVAAVLSAACSSASFEVSGAGADAEPTADSAAVDASGSDSSAPVDDSGTVTTDSANNPVDTAAPPGVDASCPAVEHSSTDVYVDAAAAMGGRGTIGCPFRTLAQAASAPYGGTVNRVVHVKAGTYNEAGAIRVRPRETYRGELGVPKIVVPASAPSCATIGSCVFNLETNTVLDNFLIDGGGVAHGIIAANAVSPAPKVLNVTVKGMAKDGIVVVGSAGLTLGPNAHSNANGGDGLQARLGKIFINLGPNGFDDNVGAGVHMLAGSLFIDNGVTANNNQVGVLFDRAGLSSLEQVLSQIEIFSNKTHGVVIGKNWSKLQIRKANINKNALTGVFMEFNAGVSNVFDLGSTGSGGNTFGAPSTKNGKAGLFLCQSGATDFFDATGNNWSACPPTQQQVAGCEAWPASYVDVAFVPAGGGGNPLRAPTSCSAMF